MARRNRSDAQRAHETTKIDIGWGQIEEVRKWGKYVEGFVDEQGNAYTDLPLLDLFKIGNSLTLCLCL